LHVPSGAKLVITEESTGSLNATSGANAAGIGGGKRENSGDVEIHGGTITAKMQHYIGSSSGAGIGGGYFGSNGSVTITGGYVNASATNGGAGIGAGFGTGYNGGTVTITGGTVIVSGKGQYTKHGAGIGGGDNSGNGGTVVITGGNVQAIAGDGAEAIGKGNGSGSSGTLKDSAGNDISLIEITLDGVSDKTSVTNIVVDGSTYGSKDVVTIGDKLYLYLPVGTKTVTAGGYTYVCYSNGQMYKNHSDWVEATCTSAKHCSRCGLTEGEALPHSYVNGVCNVCGMDENGVFHIKTAEQLVAFAQYVNAGNKDAKAVLDADIDMTDVAWTPICQTVSYHSSEATDTGYTGTFDGNGHTISNLTVTGKSGATYSYGLFGTVSGTVKHLGMDGFTFTMGSAGDARAGSVAGQVLTGGTIENCYSIGHSVTTNNNIAGGIAGCNYGGTIRNCYAYNGSVSGYETRWGGVVGDCQDDGGAYAGTVTNCYTNAERVVSTQNDSTKITNCEVMDASAFASGEVTYKLNGSTSDGDLIWYQTLGTHETPKFTGDIVMYSEGIYRNHTHEWICSLGKTDESSNVYDKIVGRCRIVGCAEPERGVTFSIPENRVYTGSPIELVVVSEIPEEEIAITYTAMEGSLTDGKPVNIGTYKAVASLTDADGQTVSTSDFIYEITKQQYTDISAVCESVDSAAKVNRACSSIDETEYYTGTIEWSVAPVNNALDPAQDYTATVTLNAKLNYKFGNVSYDGWTVESNDGVKVVLKKTYYSCCGFEVSAAGNEAVVLGTDYVYERNTKALHIVSDKPITIKNVNPSEKTDNHIVAGAGSNANITLAGVNINGSQPVLVKDDSGNVTITLKDETTNTLMATKGAGLEKQGQNSTLIIQCEHASENGHVCDGNCGTLVATGAMYGAGIGGCGREYAQTESRDPDKAIAYNITIKGGNITAHGGDGGAGIGAGGGSLTGFSNMIYGCNAKNIIIQGGIIEANGGDGGAGIGTGILRYDGDEESTFRYCVSRCENIQIIGGAVTAIGGNGGAGIGAGQFINNCFRYGVYFEGLTNTVDDIVVKGGSLKVSAGYKAHAIGDGSFYDFNEYDQTYATTPTNGNGSEVYLYCIANPDGKTVYIDGEAYAINNHTAVDGNDTNLYVYLTANTWNAPHTIKVGSDGATEKYYYRTSKLKKLAVGIYKIPENPATPTISGSSEYGAKQLSGYHLDGWTWITASKYPQVDGTDNMAYYNANYSTYDYSGITGYNSSTNRVERHIPITITQKPITITADNKTIVYGDEDVALTYTISESTPLVGKDTLSGSITRVAGSDAGTYAIKQGTLANANYAITFHNGTYTIIKANAKLNFAEDTKTLGYDGAAVTSNELSDVAVTNESDKAINATVKYSYRVNGSTGEFTSGLPTNVGTYEVKAEMESTTNYNAASDTMVLTIEKRELADCDISVIEAVTYDGTAQKPAVTVKIGNVTLNAGDYTIDYTDNINVGTATITITGNNNCTGSVTKTFVINPKTVTPTIEISDESYDYTAEAVEPEVTLKDGATVIPASEYGVAYTGNTNAGTATITVTDLEGGNYTFEAVSKEFTISTMTPIITWNDQTLASTGEVADITAPTITFAGTDKPEVVLAYSYKAQGDAEYTAGLPSDCGTYDVKVNVSATDNYNAVEDTMTLTITCTDADNNGICDHCGAYEAPELEDEYYQIANASNLMWFAQQVNEGRTAINAKLTADIDMKDIDWTTMSSFVGTFDGDGHTISYLCADESGGDDDIADGSRCGLFQTLSEGGTVTNLTISGAELWSANSAGAIAAVNNGTISKCIVKDSSIQLGASHGLAAIAGTNTGTVKDCGVVNCSMTRRWGSTNSGDYAIGAVVEDNSGTVSNCFSYGCRFSQSPNIYAIVESGNAPVNCYYYTDATVSDTVATAKTAKAFASGEVAYLLNSEKTDGTQNWYQTIGSTEDETADKYPILSNTHKTVYSYGGYYANAFTADEAGNISTERDENIGTITLDDTNTTYDGTEKAPNVIVTIGTGVNATTLTKDTDYTVTYPADMTNAGEKTITVSMKAGSGLKGTAKLNFTIEKKLPTLEDFAFTVSEDLTYSAAAKSATVKPKDGINGMGAITVSYTDSNGEAVSPVKVNEEAYVAVIKVAEGDNYKAFEATYTQTKAAGWTFHITKKDVTVTPKDQKILIGGSIDATSVSGVRTEGLALGDKVGSVTLTGTYDSSSINSDGTISISNVTIQNASGEDVTDCYNITSSATAKVNVVEHVHNWVYSAEGDTIIATCKDDEGSTCTDDDKKQTIQIKANAVTYDGESHAAETEGSIEDVDTPDIVYTFDGKTISGEPKNAGTYTASITLGDATASAVVEVKQKEITITAEPATKVYGAEDPEFTYTITGTLCGSDVLNGKLSREEGTNAGIYKITQGTLDNTNYKITFVSADFTITKKAGQDVATPVIEKTITYGTKLSAVTLPNGWKWQAPETVPTVENTGFEALYAVSDDANYDYSEIDGYDAEKHTIVRTVAVTVTKASMVVNAPETKIDVDSDIASPEDITLPEGWKLADGEADKELPFNEPVEITIIYTGEDAANYDEDALTKTITVTRVCNHAGKTEVKDAKKATCDEEGYTGDTYCKDCGVKTATGKAIEKKPHAYGEPTFDWSEDGKSAKVIFTCENDATHKVSHDATVTSEVKTEATCNDKGTTTYTAKYIDADKVYSAEGKTYTDTKDVADIPADEKLHEESDILYTGEGEKAPTCTVDGIGHTECTKCKEPMQTNVTVEASGHTGGTATCKNKAECSVCHEGYGELDKNNHAGETEVRDAKKATCAVDGYTGDTYCKDCGAKIATGTKIDKSTAHTWDNGVVTKEATATEKGEKTYTCSVCKTTKKEEIPALGAPKVGEEIASEDGSATYKVTEAEENGNSVTYEAPTDKNQATVVVPATVTINNITYNVTTISDTAFAGNKKLTSVTIGDNVTGFSDKTFKGCNNLKTVDVGNGVTSIPTNAFKNFKNLTTVKMGTGVKTIGKNAFSGCKKLKNVIIGKNVVTIGDKAFYKCTSLTKVTIPSKVKTIGKSTFEGCKALKTITIGNSVTKIGSKAFYGCSKTKTLTIKSSKLTTKKIGSKAFTKTPKNMTVKVPKKKFDAYKTMLMKRGVNKKARFKKN